MIEIEGKIVSSELLTERFLCDVGRCKGTCCVEGNAGAPLEEDEVGLLEAEWEAYRGFMTDEGVKAIEEQGFAVRDEDGDLVTPLVGDAECAYSYNKDGVTLCAVEKAWAEGRQRVELSGIAGFRKPISCHLYPIRVVKFSDGSEGLNYHRWGVCESARELGRERGVPVFRMLREAIERRFGSEFYEAMEAAEGYLNGVAEQGIVR